MGLHQVPGTDLAEETGIRVHQEDEDSDVSDLDVEIARESIYGAIIFCTQAHAAAWCSQKEFVPHIMTSLEHLLLAPTRIAHYNVEL